jgi:hypothetical protein
MQVIKHLRHITSSTPLHLAVGVIVVIIVGTPHAEAIPAFARQFNVKCSTCHTPVPPRLNNVGIIFKRMGYRMPNADDTGKLVLQDKPSRSTFDDFSLIGDFRLEDSRDTKTKFVLDEVEAMGAGAVGRYLSYLTMATWEDGEASIETLEGQVLLGRPDRNFTARFGMFEPLAWEKFGHERLTIARPLLPSVRVPVDDFDGFRLDDMQQGVEVGLNFNHLGDAGALRSTFLSLGVYDGSSGAVEGMDEEESPGIKNVMAQVVHLWGDSNTVGAMWYSGKISDIGMDAFDDRVDRWAVFGNHRFNFGTDVLAGVGGGRDDTKTADIGRIPSRSWFVELNQAFASRASALLRYDDFKRNTDVPGADLRGPTIGVATHPLDNLLLTAEYRGIRAGSDTRGRDFTVRAIIVY